MCNNAIMGHFVRPKHCEPDLSPKTLIHIERDVIFVSKEKFKIPAHQIALARNRFWRNLFTSMVGAKGVCPERPLVIYLPDIEYNTIRLYVTTYYKDKVQTKKADATKLEELIVTLHPEFKIGKSGRRNAIDLLSGGRVEGEEDDYSGGMSSPDESDSDSDEEDNHNITKSPAVMEASDPISKKSPRSSSGGDGLDRNDHFKCRGCKMTLKSRVGLKKHVVSKHIFKDLSKWIEDNHDIDTKNFTCKFSFRNGRKCTKESKDERSLITHLATFHNLVEGYLKSSDDKLENWAVLDNNEASDLRADSHGDLGAESTEDLRAESPEVSRAESHRDLAAASNEDLRTESHGDAQSRISHAESKKSTESDREDRDESKHEEGKEDDKDEDQDSTTDGSDIGEQFAKFCLEQHKVSANTNDEGTDSGENSDDNMDNDEAEENEGAADSEDDRSTQPADGEADNMDIDDSEEK